MTEKQQTELSGQIATALFGWHKSEAGAWVDPTGDEFKKPPNYTDNSGLVVGLEFKLRRRGYNIQMSWLQDQAVQYTLSQGEQEFNGVAETKSLALCLAIKDALSETSEL